MHRPIFELNKEPFANENDYRMFTYEDLEDLPPSVDYILDSERERSDDIELLSKHLKQFGEVTIKDSTLTVEKGFKEAYFESRYDTLKKRVDDLTFDEFLEPIGFERFLIKRTINDEYDFRIYSFDYGHETLDDFVRRLEYDTPYYIGGIGDLHF